MVRVYLEKGEQALFLRKVKEKLTHLTWREIAEICGVERHTLQSWRKEKYRMSYRALMRLSRLSGVPTPRILEVISEKERRRRACVKAGKTTQAKYGCPFTQADRSKGGRASQQRRREHPELFYTPDNRKAISVPPNSARLAELVGILLGDGSITTLQVTVSHNAEKEQEYGHFVAGLFKKLFGLDASAMKVQKNCAGVVVSSVALVEYLESIGLKRGDKLVSGVGVPEWVFASETYMRACVRGLMDTDGCIFLRRQRSHGRERRYLELHFSSHSTALREGMMHMLQVLGFTPRQGRKNVSLYRQREIHRYFEEIGASNAHHLERYRRFSAAGTADLARCR